MADYSGSNDLKTFEGLTKEQYAPSIVNLTDKFRKIRKRLQRITPKEIKVKK